MANGLTDHVMAGWHQALGHVLNLNMTSKIIPRKMDSKFKTCFSDSPGALSGREVRRRHGVMRITHSSPLPHATQTQETTQTWSMLRCGIGLEVSPGEVSHGKRKMASPPETTPVPRRALDWSDVATCSRGPGYRKTMTALSSTVSG